MFNPYEPETEEERRSNAGEPEPLEEPEPEEPPFPDPEDERESLSWFGGEYPAVPEGAVADWPSILLASSWTEPVGGEVREVVSRTVTRELDVQRCIFPRGVNALADALDKLITEHEH